MASASGNTTRKARGQTPNFKPVPRNEAALGDPDLHSTHPALPWKISCLIPKRPKPGTKRDSANQTQHNKWQGPQVSMLCSTTNTESVWNTSSSILDTDVNLEHRRRLFGTFSNDTFPSSKTMCPGTRSGKNPVGIPQVGWRGQARTRLGYLKFGGR